MLNSAKTNPVPLGQWFYEPKQGFSYWLITEPIYRAFATKAYPGTIPESHLKTNREITPNDVHQDNYALRDGRVVPIYVAHTYVTYPEYPSVASFRLINPEQQELIQFNKSDVAVYHGQEVVVQVAGRKILCFYVEPEETIEFMRLGIGHGIDLLALYQRLLGKWFELSAKNGIWGISNKVISWMPIYPGLTVNPTKQLTTNQKSISFHLRQHEQIYKMIQDYVNSITPECLIEAMKDYNVKPILYRCPGCKSCDLTHLSIHLERGEINPYLINEIYISFGGLHWEWVNSLVHGCQTGNLKEIEKFKSLALSFLQNHLLTSSELIVDLPKNKPKNLFQRWSFRSKPREGGMIEEAEMRVTSPSLINDTLIASSFPMTKRNTVTVTLNTDLSEEPRSISYSHQLKKKIKKFINEPKPNKIQPENIEHPDY